MRNAILGLSYLLFGASFLISILAVVNRAPSSSVIPTSVVREQPSAESVAIQDKLERLTQEKNTNQAVIQELKSTIAQLQQEVQKIQSVPPASPQPERKPSASPEQTTTLLVLGDGSFKPGQVVPAVDLAREIEKIVPSINAKPSDKILVEGHSDSFLNSSSAEKVRWNQNLSLLRAKAVANILQQQGVPAERIIVRGLGDSVPLAPNTTELGRAKNRRVEIKLIPAP